MYESIPRVMYATQPSDSVLCCPGGHAGSIPQQLGKLGALEELSLSHNKLTGEF